MKIDLSSVNIFEDNELELDKKITFIFGKNGTGKSTITEEIKKLNSDYDVSVFQGFNNVIDENHRLNAVVLGEENLIINTQIEQKKKEIELKQDEIDKISKTLSEPEVEEDSNFWTRKRNAQEAYRVAEKKLNDFYTQSASTIKNKKNPQIAKTSYNKRNFQDDLQSAALLQDDEKKELIETIKSEVKTALNILFPCEDMTQLLNEINSILQKTVTERVKVKRIDNNPEKREFAKRGLKLHKKGEVCAFCGNEIKDDVFDELESYFSADEVKEFQMQIAEKIESIDLLIEWLMERGKLNILVATTTIAQGINFPVSTIIMASIAYPYTSEMPIRDFWNLVGRAGRAGQNDVGMIGITIGARNDNQKQEELAKLTRYVKKSTEELVSQLQKIAEKTIEFGEQFSLTVQFYNPEWSQFLQYITHMFNQCKDLGEFEEKTDLFLRRTFGYSNIEPRKQKILLSAVKEYGEVLNKNKGLAKLSDSTGFSMETLGRTAYRIKELGIRQDNLKGSSLFGNDSQLKDLIGIMMNIPEISKNMQDIAKGNRNLSGDMIARFTTDWVNGTKLETLASQYFGDDRDAMTECCQAIYGKLVNSATWGLSTIQKLGINEDSLSEEELQKAANLPAMIYYGVNSDEAILMRMNNVPRSVAAEMGVEYKKDFDNVYKQSSYEIRQWIEGLSSDKWDAFAENKRGMSGSDYRAIWEVLNNES